MDILITERPFENGYIESLINAYSRSGNTVTCDASNFFYSNRVPDVLHIHWPERLYKWNAPAETKASNILKIIEDRLLWYKNNGTKILHTIHNLAPHDSKHRIDEQGYRLIIKYADILVHHCKKSVSLLTDMYPESLGKTSIVCPHGDYLIHYRQLDQGNARKLFNIPEGKTVILNFGRQRPYKNENFLTSAFRNLAVDSKYLVIAGVFEYPENSHISQLFFRVRNKIRKSVKFSNKKYIYRHFTVQEMTTMISCADIVFLGQQNALNSGLLALAASFGKPVVCADTGCFREAVSGWCHEIYKPGDIADASKALRVMCERVLEIRKESGSLDNSAWLAKNSWEQHVMKILSHIRPAATGEANTL